MSKFNYDSITQFQQHVDLKDYRTPTRKEYVRNLRKLAEHFQRDPAELARISFASTFCFSASTSITSTAQ